MGRSGIWMLALLTLALCKAGVAQLVLYDNFNSKQIDPAKWVGAPTSLASDANRREVAVQVVGEKNRRLRISETIYSANTDNTGSGGDGFGVSFASPEKVTAVSFTLALNKDAASSCTGYLSYGWAGAGFFGRYFNPTDAHDGPLGDIAASVSIGRLSADPPGSLSVSAAIVRCGDKTPSCDTQISLSSQTLGYVQLGSNNTFSVAWDQANHQFIFQLNNDSPVPLAYAESDAFPPGLQDKSFWVAGNVPHCTTRPRRSAAIDALFDNAYVNR
jgi:hypothetical protein